MFWQALSHGQATDLPTATMENPEDETHIGNSGFGYAAGDLGNSIRHPADARYIHARTSRGRQPCRTDRFRPTLSIQRGMPLTHRHGMRWLDTQVHNKRTGREKTRPVVWFFR